MGKLVPASLSYDYEYELRMQALSQFLAQLRALGS